MTLGSGSAAANAAVTGTYSWSFSNSGPSSTAPGGSDTNDPTNQSRLVVNGDLTMAPATFNVVGLSGLSFNNTQPYNWRVATATGNVITGATQPTFTTTSLNTGGGSFQLSGGAGGVFLQFSPVPEPVAILGLCVLAAGIAQTVRLAFLPRRGCISQPGVAQRTPGTSAMEGTHYPEGVTSARAGGALAAYPLI